MSRTIWIRGILICGILIRGIGVRGIPSHGRSSRFEANVAVRACIAYPFARDDWSKCDDGAALHRTRWAQAAGGIGLAWMLSATGAALQLSWADPGNADRADTVCARAANPDAGPCRCAASSRASTILLPPQTGRDNQGASPARRFAFLLLRTACAHTLQIGRFRTSSSRTSGRADSRCIGSTHARSNTL